MQSYESALQRVLTHANRMQPECVELLGCLGHCLDEDVTAPFPIPRFDNSAVDGYAVADADAYRQGPIPVVGLVPAGSQAGTVLQPGQAIQVLTGAMVPQGTFAVVMQEDVEREGGTVRVSVPVREGQHIRRAGDEYKQGELIVERGTTVTPPLVATLAALGRTTASVVGSPRIGLLATGSELAKPGQQLGPAQIYESNSFALSAVLAHLGLSAHLETVPDDVEATQRVLENLVNRSTVVFTSGGVSVGMLDHIPASLKKLGFESDVAGVAIKPGKPFTLATRSDGKLIVCLPGNPMSALVTFTLFGWPLLNGLMGLPQPAWRTAKLERDETNRSDRDELVPGRANWEPAGTTVVPSPTVGSHAVAGLASANCLIRIPPHSTSKRGDPVPVYPLPWSCLS